MRGVLADTIIDPMELGSDYTVSNTGYTRHIVDDSQLDSDAFATEQSLFNPTLSKHDDSNNGIHNTNSPETAEPQRLPPPRSSVRHCDKTLLLSRLDVGKRHGEKTDHSNPGGSGDEDRPSKRQKSSALLSDGTATKFGSEISDRSRSLTSELSVTSGDEEDGTLSSVDGKLVGTASTTPASESAPTKGELCLGVIDPDQDWEVREIIGREYVGGVLHYMVDWHPTLLPEQSLEDSKDLIKKFEAKLRAHTSVKQRRGCTSLKPGTLPTSQDDIRGLQEPKRPRGRPRKQL